MKPDSYNRLYFDTLKQTKKGFTLIESIAALVMIAVIAGLLLPVWTSGIRGTSEGSLRLADSHSLRSEMEILIADFQGPVDPALVSLIESRYSADPVFDVLTTWMEVTEANPGSLSFSATANPTEHLRVSLIHNPSGSQMQFQFSNLPITP